MRDLLSRTGTAALIAGLALAVAGCGGSETAAEPEANLSDGNMMLDEPANDASALESTADPTEPAPVANEAEATEEPEDSNPLGETSGGDTGGNTVESNVSGM